MKPAPFVRHVPRTLDEALTILSELAGQDGRILAGGQSLVPIMAFRLAKPAHLIDINEVAGLDRLSSDSKTLSIGARVRHAAFHGPVVDNPLGRLLTYVARTSRIIRSACAAPLRQPGACRSGVGMVPDRGDARRHHDRQEQPRHARDHGRGFLRRHHVDFLAEDELLTEARLPLARGRRQIRLLRIQPPRRRFRHGVIAGHLPHCRRIR